MTAADILARVLALYAAQDIPAGQRTETFTLDGHAYYQVTPGQYASLIAVTPREIRELNQARQET